MKKIIGFVITGLLAFIVWYGPFAGASAVAATKPVCQQDILMAPLKALAKTVAVTTSQTGAISGTVTDKNGDLTGILSGPFPNIRVTATQVLTASVCANGVQQDAMTDANGNYSIPNLPSGTYTVKFENPLNSFLPAGTPKAVTQWYNNVTDETLAASVQVSAPGTTTGINAALYAGGSISGTVRGAGGIALEGISVSIDGAGSSLASTLTDVNGTYELGGLATGIYTVSFSDNSGLHSPQYANMDYPNTVSVTAPNNVTGKDITLQQGGTITGTVSPATSAFITIMPTGSPNVAAFGFSDPLSGAFSVGGLATGTYTVSINAQSAGFLPATILGVSVAGTGTTNTGTTTLTIGGKISGTVRNTTLTPLQNIMVMAVNATSGDYAGGALSTADGTYTIGGLATGNYKVQFLTCDGGFATQWYNGQTTQGAATPVSVSAPSTTTGITGTLAVVVPVTYPLTLTFAGTGGGSVNSDKPGINCVSGPTCPAASYDSGIIVTLTAVPDGSSTFTGWSGGGCSIGDCVVTMNSSTAVTATFTLLLPVKTDITNVFNSSIVSAYTLAPSGAKLLLKEQNFIETFIFGMDKQIGIVGGYNAAFTAVGGRSSLKGPVYVRAGAIRVKNIDVR